MFLCIHEEEIASDFNVSSVQWQWKWEFAAFIYALWFNLWSQCQCTKSWLALGFIFFQFMGFSKVQKMAWRWFGRFDDFPQQTSARAGTVAPVWLPRKVLPLAILAMRQTIPQMFGVRELDLIPPHFFPLWARTFQWKIVPLCLKHRKNCECCPVSQIVTHN